MKLIGILIGICGVAGVFAILIWQKRKIEWLREQIDHFLYFSTDMVEENSREGEWPNLQNSVRELEKMVHTSQQLYTNRESQLIEFMENLSHQMKTAITAIQIRLELAMFKKGENKQKELINCQQCVDRLTEEVDRLLSSSLLAAHKTNLNYQKTNITQQLDNVVAQLLPLAQKEEKSIQFETSGEVSAMVDPFWMEQVFVNLIKNAVEHTGEGTEVKVQLKLCENGFAVNITDHGNGISQSDMERLFERFYSAKGKRRGYGIGLSMSKDIVDLHHGTIQVRNLPEEGAMFTVHIPDISETKPYETVSSL